MMEQQAALALWRKVTMEIVREKDDLSSRQMLVLLVAYGKPGMQTVGQMSDAFGICKGAISRAINHLVSIGLVRRVEDPSDRRITRIKCTRAGAEYVEALGDSIVRIGGSA